MRPGAEFQRIGRLWAVRVTPRCANLHDRSVTTPLRVRVCTAVAAGCAVLTLAPAPAAAVPQPPSGGPEAGVTRRPVPSPVLVPSPAPPATGRPGGIAVAGHGLRVRIDPEHGIRVVVHAGDLRVRVAVRPPGHRCPGVAADVDPPGVRVRIGAHGPGCARPTAPPPPDPPPQPDPPHTPAPPPAEPWSPPPAPPSAGAPPAPRAAAPPPPRPVAARPTPSDPPRTPPPTRPEPRDPAPEPVTARAVAPHREADSGLPMVTRTLLIVAPAVLAAAALRPRGQSGRAAASATSSSSRAGR